MRFKLKYLYIVLIVLLGFISIASALFEVSRARSFQFFGGLTDRVKTDKKIVALTFDDAPTEYSDEVLKLVKDKKIKATFFMIGSNIEKYPKEAKHIADAGMELGNHSYSHPRFYFKSQSFIDEEIQKTNVLIKQTGYKDEITFRPPNGKKLIGLPWYLSQKGIKTIMWDVEPDTYVNSQDPFKKQQTTYVNYTIDKTKPGSIILIHPFCKECTVARSSLPTIIDALKKKGYSFVTVSELLALQ